jgi:molybdopterin molybdotransferase
VLELEEALERVLAAVPAPVPETIPLAEAFGRIAVRNVHAAIDLPAFDNSAMDGFAVRAADTANAGAVAPARLRLTGRAAAGEVFSGELGSGECVRVFTGSALPRGSDAVVMQEDTSNPPDSAEIVEVLSPVTPWENVRFRGGDLKHGSAICVPGQRMTAATVSLMAAAGVATVDAGRRAVAALIATGSELQEPGGPLKPGHIYESNRVGLAALARQVGTVTKPFPLVPDTREATISAIIQALDSADMLITSGGVSVGEFDFVKDALKEAGGEPQFWKVAIKPGRPFMFGGFRGKLVFGLPGNPVSAMITFLLLVRPALLRYQGASDTGLPSIPGKLAEPLQNPGARRHFFRVVMDPHGVVRSAGVQGSHVLSSMAAANGLVDVPPSTTLAAESVVKVLRWD